MNYQAKLSTIANFHQLAILASVSLLGLWLSLFLQPPAAWIITGILTGVVCVSTDRMMRAHPQFRLLAPTFPPALWILPALLSLGSVLFFRLVEGDALKIGGLAASVVLLTIVVVSQYHSINPADRRFGLARFFLHITTYIVAAGFYIAIFQKDLGPLSTASGIGFITLLLSLELFRENAGDAAKAWLYAAVVALILSQIAFAMDFLPLDQLAASIISLLAFYLFTGIVLNHFAHRLTKGTVVEFTVVAAIGLAFLYIRSFF